MSISSLYQKALAKIYDLYSDNPGRALIHTTVIGNLLSSLAHVTMIVSNKKIEKKEKKFLIPQEIADATVNTVLFFTLSKFIKNSADNFLESGKVSLDKTEKLISEFKNNNLLNLEELKKSKQFTSRFYERASEALKTVLKQSKNPDNQTSELLKRINDGQKEFKGFKTGIGVIAAVGTSILASNIITPVCRNMTANYFQNRYKNKPVLNPVYTYNQPKIFNDMKI